MGFEMSDFEDRVGATFEDRTGATFEGADAVAAPQVTIDLAISSYEIDLVI